MNDDTLLREDAALLFLGGQYLFRWKQEGAVHLKFVSPASVRAAFSTEPLDSGWLLPTVRRWGINANGAWAVMFIPPARHEFIFDGIVKDQPATALTLPLPGLVFMLTGSKGYIWALKDEFAPDALLYRAPLPNVYSDTGAICFGGNRLEGKSIAQVWQLFLASPFNGSHAGDKSRREPRNICALLVSMQGKKRYPLRDLVPLDQRGITVEQAVSRITKDKSP